MSGISGMGLSYRRRYHTDILDNADQVDCIEVIADQFINASESELDRLIEIADRFSVSLHCLEMSPGTPELDWDYFNRIRRLAILLNVDEISDHLAFTRSGTQSLGHLAPMAQLGPIFQKTADKINRIQEYFGQRLLLETITQYDLISGSFEAESELLDRLCDETGCRILLDIANIRINALNRRLNPALQVAAYRPDLIAQVHIAGGYVSDGEHIDGHCAVVDEPVWELLEAVLDTNPDLPVILEHDAHFPPFDVFLDQMKRGRTLIKKRC